MSASPLPSVSSAAMLPARNRLARHAAPFLWLEAARRMAERLPLLRLEPETVLDVGCAWGDGLELLRRRWPAARIVGVEPAARLAARARDAHAADGLWRRLRGRGATEVRHAALEAPLQGQDELREAQMLWSNLALPWSADAGALLRGWAGALSAGGVVMFTTFGPDTLRELREIGIALPAFPDMHDLGDRLAAEGFAEPVMDMEMLHLRWADAAPALAEVAELGRPPWPGAARGLRTPRRWQALQDVLRAQARAAGREGVELTFELVYGHAFKPATVGAHAGVASFPLEQLRASARRR
jgi:malonyl-CoA O-methyltransferase